MMIRQAKQEETREIVDIWLEASRLAHDFIPYEFWGSRAGEMETIYLPSAENYVVESEGELAGFLSLADNYLAALFIRPTQQGRGYGRQLLDFAKSRRDSLTLCVYAKNSRAVKFYQAAGFQIVEERMEPLAGESEMVMEWNG